MLRTNNEIPYAYNLSKKCVRAEMDDAAHIMPFHFTAAILVFPFERLSRAVMEVPT